jgi:hypothetical protein
MILIFLILLAVPVYGQFDTQLSGPVTINGGSLNIASGASSPSGVFGSVFANTSTGTLQIHNGTAWTNTLNYTGTLDKSANIVYDGGGWITELPVYGELYNSSIGNITANGAYDTLNLNTQGELSNFEKVGTGLKYTGTYAVRVLVNFSASVEHSGGNRFFLRVRQNGTGEAKSAVRNAGGPDNILIAAGSCILNLQPDDIVQLEYAADENGIGYTIYEANLILTKI